MEQWPVEGGLTVLVDGVVRRRLRPRPGCVLKFGRAPEGEHHLHVGPSGKGENTISRVAGAIRWHNSRWTFTNESTGIPFEVEIWSTVFHLAPRSLAQSGEVTVPESGAVIRLATRVQTYEIGLQPVPRTTDSGSVPAPGAGPDTPPPMSPPTPHERRLLAAKFLSRRTLGDAIGDDLAARRATEAAILQAEDSSAADHLRPITARAVENCVRRARDRLRELGWHGLDGRSNIDRVGRLLLSYGALRRTDVLPLPVVADDDPGVR